MRKGVQWNFRVILFSLDTWKRTKTGGLSTAGTTACTVIFRQDHIFVANVGDSTAVLAINAPQPNQHPIKAVVLTNNHKPEDPKEAENIEKLGKENGTYLKSLACLVMTF